MSLNRALIRSKGDCSRLSVHQYVFIYLLTYFFIYFVYQSFGLTYIVEAMGKFMPHYHSYATKV